MAEQTTAPATEAAPATGGPSAGTRTDEQRGGDRGDRGDRGGRGRRGGKNDG